MKMTFDFTLICCQAIKQYKCKKWKEKEAVNEKASL